MPNPFHTSNSMRLFRRYRHKISLHLPHFYLDFSNRQFLWWIIVFVYLIFTISFFLSPLIRLSNIVCTIDVSNTCPDFIVPQLRKYTGQLLYTLPLSTISAQIQAASPNLNNVVIIRQWPNTLNIQLTTKIPLANLQIPASSSALLISRQYDVLDFLSQPHPELPTIIASTAANLSLGDKLADPALITAADLAKDLPSLINDPLIKINIISPLTIQVKSATNTQYYFTSNKPMTDQLYALQLILAQSTIDKSSHIIDVRFDKPVIKPMY